MSRLIVLMAFVLLPVISAAETDETAQVGALSFGTGVEFSTGKYGGVTSTDIFYLPLAFKYFTSGYALSLTVPYIFSLLKGLSTSNPDWMGAVYLSVLL